MSAVDRLPEHDYEKYCRAGEDDPTLGRTVEDLLINIHGQNENPRVLAAVETALYDLHALMTTLFELIRTLDEDPDLEIEQVCAQRRYDA